MNHPIITAAHKLLDEVNLPETLQTAVLLAANHLACHGTIDKLALIQYMADRGQNAADDLGHDKIRLTENEWTVVLMRDLPLGLGDAWRIELNDHVMGGIVTCEGAQRPRIRRFWLKDELTADDPADVLPEYAENTP